MHTHLGKVQSKTITATQTGFDSQGAFGVMIYHGHFEHGDVTIRFRFQKDAGVWKIAALHYDSNVFTNAVPSTDM